MKINKLIFPAFIALAMTACSDEPEGNHTAHPPGQGTEEVDPEPEKPSQGTEEEVTSPVPSFGLSSKSLALDVNKTYQEIEGFGASDCWLPNTLGQYWTSGRLQMARWLFSQNISGDQPQGIGLSMWRVNLGGGTAEIGAASGINDDSKYNRAESYLNASGTGYDWNKCAGQQYFMQQALNNGVEKFILFSNSPLVQWTKNGQGRSDSGKYANLKEEYYDDFAEYMADVAEHFTGMGYNIAAISPVNEPQYNWEGNSQEGSGWQNTEIARLTRFLDQALTDRGLDTEISVGEAGHWDHLYQKVDGDGRDNTIDAFYNPSSEAYIGDLNHTGNIICGHSYWTYSSYSVMNSVRQSVADAAKKYGLRVWQTEWSMLDAPPQGIDYGSSTDFEIAQAMSMIIHSDLTKANCTSWSYWTAMSVANRWDHRIRFELIDTQPRGGLYDSNFDVEGSIAATPNLWVLGNYSLFIRPGYTRVDLNHSETQNFFASAYVAPDRSKVVVVVTNKDKEKGATLDMITPEGTKSIYRYTTSETKNLLQERFNVNDKVFVDPASVTTIVYNL